MKELELQKDNLHDLLEKGIYNVDTYLERLTKLSEKIADTQKNIDETEFALSNEIQHEKARKDIIPTVENVLKVYEKSNNPNEKNKMLRSVLENATYRKEKWQKGDHFTLVLNPRLPQ